MIHCRLCDTRPFRDISTLRKHQWAAHAELFAKTRKSLQSPAVRKKRAAGLRHAAARRKLSVVRLEEVPKRPNGRMLASELLTQLQSQQRFLNDVVSLVSGIIAQHEGNK